MPGKRQKSAVEKYHDRVAGIYDSIYSTNPYWETVVEITWRHLRKFIPTDHASQCLDVGCGTGRWGLKLIKSGYQTDFLDISGKMLEQVRKKLARLSLTFSPEIFHLSLDNIASLPSENWHLIIGQGDPLNSVARPGGTFKELTRLLKPGGIMVMSVDNRLAGISHYLEKSDLGALKKFLRDGRTQWVTAAAAERFKLTMFTPEEIRRMCAARGLELLSLIGKTVLPLRQHQHLLQDRRARRELIAIEESLHAREVLLGGASHLEFVARKPKG